MIRRLQGQSMTEDTRTGGPGALAAGGESTAPPAAGDDGRPRPGSPTDTGPPPPAAGRYELIGEIARGGMGVVYRARDPRLGRDVAVKLMHSRHRPSPAAVRRFTDEAA